MISSNINCIQDLISPKDGSMPEVRVGEHILSEYQIILIVAALCALQGAAVKRETNPETN